MQPLPLPLPSQQPRIGLVMIVKDEAAVIQRALLSAKPCINTWLIVDTGSTDSTKELILQTMSDISGHLLERPWVNFGHNRSEALALCDPHMDWAIMLDADDNLAGTQIPAELFAKHNLDGLVMRIQHEFIWHQRVQVFRTGRGWYYKGIIHEHPFCGSTEKPLLGLLPPETYMVTRCEGVRSRNPNKYRDDAALLEAEYSRNPTDSRNLFYLAQSYRDAGDRTAARICYAKYLDISSGVWPQERYIALLNLVQLFDLTPVNAALHMQLAWEALDICPDRVEVPFATARIRRAHGIPPTRQLYALLAATPNRKPDLNAMFVNPAIYEWGMDDELAVVAFETGHYREAYEASLRCMLHAPTEEMRGNARRNAIAAKALS